MQVIFILGKNEGKSDVSVAEKHEGLGKQVTLSKSLQPLAPCVPHLSRGRVDLRYFQGPGL